MLNERNLYVVLASCILKVPSDVYRKTPKIACNGGDLTTINYVLDTININICSELFGNATQSSYY